MVSNVAQPYEEPVPSVFKNPIYFSNLRHYEDSINISQNEKSAPHYEFDSQQNGNAVRTYQLHLDVCLLFCTCERNQ